MNMTFDGAYLLKKRKKSLPRSLAHMIKVKKRRTPYSRRHNLNNDIIFNLFVASPSPTNCTGAKLTRLQGHSKLM